jgi:RimJ/RimL family protein N-acetyltransferase
MTTMPATTTMISIIGDRRPAAGGLAVARGGKGRDTGHRMPGQCLVLIDHWPLLGLRLTSPGLELRLPSGEELGELADLAADGMHGPRSVPFLVSWPGLPPAERARALVQRHWRRRGDWSPDDWSHDLAVFADGRVAGQQEISGRDYRILREVSTFSWLGLRYQGQGLGTQMRAAVLPLAFAGPRLAARGRATTTRRLRLPRARWEMSERIPVSVTGLPPCLPLFGLRDGGAS